MYGGILLSFACQLYSFNQICQPARYICWHARQLCQYATLISIYNFDLVSTIFTIWGGHTHHQLEIPNKSSKSNTKHSDFEIDAVNVSDLW